MLGSSWDDPRTLATLAAAQQLLSGSGSSIQRIADAGMSYGGTLEQRKSVETERQRRMAETLLMQQRVAQLAQAQKDAEAQAQAQARDEGLMTRLLGMPVEQQMPAGVEGPGAQMQNTGIDPRTFLNQGGSLGALPKVGALNQFMATPSVERKIVGNPKDGLWDITDPDSPRQIVAPTEKPNMNELIIPDGKGGYMINEPLLRARQQIAASGATNVSLGSPVPFELPSGGVGYVQPANRPGAAPQVLTVPGSSEPAKRPNENKLRPLTEAEAKATTFASQMAAAERELAGVPIDPTKLSAQIETQLAGSPVNIAISQSAQRARQAQEQWSEAYLRFKTGAATTADEIRRNVRTFFPQQGDKPETVEQKKRMREQALNDILFAAGTGASNVQKPDGKNPRIGEVRKGYKYIGGDPSQPSSWEKAQ